MFCIQVVSSVLLCPCVAFGAVEIKTKVLILLYSLGYTEDLLGPVQKLNRNKCYPLGVHFGDYNILLFFVGNAHI